MRYMTIGAMALAATLGLSGLARAADEPSRYEADEEAEAAAQMQYDYGMRPLGYAQPRWRNHPLANVPGTWQEPDPALQHLTPDENFLRQGDRGRGGE